MGEFQLENPVLRRQRKTEKIVEFLWSILSSNHESGME